MSEQDETYENTLSIEELRREVRRCWDRENALIKALRDLPEVPHSKVLLLLSRAAKWSDDNNIGIQLQRKFGSTAIPYKSEYEGGAGVWYRIRRGMKLPRPATISASTGDSTRETEG